MASAVDSSGLTAASWERGDGHLSTLPFDLNEHVVLADFFLRQAEHFDSLTLPEWRSCFRSDAVSLKGERQFSFQIVVPAHRFLFRSVGIHNRFFVYAIFTNRIFGGLLHRLASSIRRTDVRPMCSRRAISALLTPARWS